jgi:hypothetical protein
MFVAVLLFLSETGFAQRDSISHSRFGVSYFSQGGFYPGFAFNYEKKLLSNARFQLLLAGKTGAYFHYRNQSGVFIMVQSGQRFQLYRNLYFEHFVGIGYLQTFLNGGDAYYVNASGQVQKTHTLGNPHFMPSVSTGISYDLKGEHDITIFTRPMIYWQIPFNQTSLVQYAFEIGTVIRLKK